jgi:outer membrane scaffolding protein for murein synthesis (MipA/OmpV family)
VRAAIATDFSHTNGVGFVFSPHLSYTTRPLIAGVKWNLGAQAGPIFATGEFHQYFYGVDQSFASAERPAYSADGGYSGAYALMSLSRRFPRFWIGAFARFDMLKGAVFEDSPLVRRDYAFMAGVALAWVFAESSKKVRIDVDE